MVEPLSITASLLAVITAAVQSTTTLCDTITRFKDRDKTLARLHNELHDLTTILDSLKQAIDTETSMFGLLQGPIERCTQICREFEQSMESFGQKSKTGFRDWTKMEFMRGDINEFIDTISGYKSTISVGLGTVTIHTAKVSQKVLKDYNEMIQDTAYNLEVHLQRIDEKLTRFTIENPSPLNSDVDLRDEKEVTKQCLRVCEDASHYIESLAKRESSLLDARLQNATEDDGQNQFEAQTITRQVLDGNRNNFAMIINQLQSRLESLVLKNGPGYEAERSRLLSDINTSKQCLEVCRVATEASTQKVYRVGEVVADGDSDQVVVNTLADLFDVKKALSLGTSAQLVGSMTEEALRHLTEKRYGSRFGARPQESDAVDVLGAGSSLTGRTNKSRDFYVPQDGDEQSSRPKPRHRPTSNEVRKRYTREELD